LLDGVVNGPDGVGIERVVVDLELVERADPVALRCEPTR